MKRIVLLGSTGSIGVQTLDVCRRMEYEVVALACGKNMRLAQEQAREFKPGFVAVADEKAARELRIALADTSTEVLGGSEAVLKAASTECDIVLNAISGIAGLAPSVAALSAGTTLALANKETLVAGGRKVMELAKKNGVRILPVDSEHSAIFQCIQAKGDHERIKNLILTASGGPFFGMTGEQLKSVSAADALQHPTWNMGHKVTIDSATMVNKGLEIMEAALLFDILPEDIKVVIHRESIVHSLVEFCDNSVLSQMGTPDMRTPIQYALTWPERAPGAAKRLDLAGLSRLTFAAPDEEAFPAMRLAREAFSAGGLIPAAFNAADEVAVEAFLAGKIGFLQITDIIEKVIAGKFSGSCNGFEDIFEADREARVLAVNLIDGR